MERQNRTGMAGFDQSGRRKHIRPALAAIKVLQKRQVDRVSEYQRSLHFDNILIIFSKNKMPHCITHMNAWQRPTGFQPGITIAKAFIYRYRIKQCVN